MKETKTEYVPNPVPLGERMKMRYERPSRYHLLRKTPVIIRVDGRAFHTFTRKFDKPFDKDFIAAMLNTALRASTEIQQGVRAAYVQSDEISFFLADYDDVDTEAWFDYNKAKVESITASIATAFFNEFIQSKKKGVPLAFFDARAFNIPREEVVNYFLWRMKDWARNSLTMYCRGSFSHKQLEGKNAAAQHELLHTVGKNWATDLSPIERNGTLILRTADGGFVPESNYVAKYDVVSKLIPV